MRGRCTVRDVLQGMDGVLTVGLALTGVDSVVCRLTAGSYFRRKRGIFQPHLKTTALIKT